MSSLVALSLLLAVAGSGAAGDVLATVDGEAVTAADLDLFLALRGVTGPVAPAFRDRALDELIDRKLVRRFLATRKAEPDAGQLAAAVRAAKAKLAATGRDPDEALRTLGVDEARLKAELVLPLAWRLYVRRVVTDQQVADRYDAHRRRFDGTRLRVSQVFLPYAAGETPAAAPETTRRLEDLAGEVRSGRLTFTEAARARSQAPTASAGGDVGWIGPTGDLPRAVSKAAFALEPGEVAVALSPLGGHLVTVTEVRPGNGSLEDARPAVLDELADKLWRDTVAAARREAKIVRSGE